MGANILQSLRQVALSFVSWPITLLDAELHLTSPNEPFEVSLVFFTPFSQLFLFVTLLESTRVKTISGYNKLEANIAQIRSIPMSDIADSRGGRFQRYKSSTNNYLSITGPWYMDRMACWAYHRRIKTTRQAFEPVYVPEKSNPSNHQLGAKGWIVLTSSTILTLPTKGIIPNNEKLRQRTSPSLPPSPFVQEVNPFSRNTRECGAEPYVALEFYALLMQ